MATVPDPGDGFSQGVLDTSDLNARVIDTLNFLLDKPVAMMLAAADQSLPTGAFTALTLGAETVDTDPSGTGGHDNSTNPSRYTAVYPGWYLVSGVTSHASNATGQRGGRFAVNGSSVTGSTVRLNAAATVALAVPMATVTVYLSAGDYVELTAWQDSGGALNTAYSSGREPSMTVVWERRA